MAQFKRANTSYFKFMFVRHPMRRILSCYIDKMNYLKVAIIKYARSHTSRRLLLLEPGKQYDQEVQQQTNTSTIIDDTSTEHSHFELNGTERINGSEINDANNTAIPTFEEFLEYVLSRTDKRGEY